MPCTNCSNSALSTFNVQYFYNNQPSNCEDSECGSNSLQAKCVWYGGPNLSCSGIQTGDSLELALQKIDEQICAATGDYSTYNFSCLDNEAAITTEAGFVSTISAYICTLNTTLTTFTGTTFPAYQAAMDVRLDAIEVPNISAPAYLGINASDTIQQVLTKLASKINTIHTTELSLSGVDWDQCFTVSSTPTTIAQGFSTLLDQICQLSGGDATLPSFNNSGSCLPSPGVSDSLVATIEKIKTRLCQSPILDNDNLSSSCISIPATDNDLEGLLQNILTKMDTLSQNLLTFDSGDFSVSLTDSENACAGKTVALATPLNQDRLVASNASDTAPGTLISKLQAGANVSLDDTTIPGKILIHSSGGTDTKELKASSVDTTPGFLDQKLEGGSDDAGVEILLAYNASSKKVTISPSLDLSVLIPAIFDFIEDDAELKTRFCELTQSCPSPCEGPTNVQAVQLSSSTTTTTTTSL